MSVIVIGVATESGVPIFSRKRGTSDNIQFSTIASLHGINMFSKCHNVSILNTLVDNGTIIWKEDCKSITLIGIVSGGLEHDLKLLSSFIYDIMILFIGKKELDAMKNVEQIKKNLRQCYPIMDYLLESLDPNTTSSNNSILVLDLIETMLCPQSVQLQQALDNYSEQVTGHWACLSINGRLVATSSDFNELSTREQCLMLLLLTTQDGVPLREMPIYLPHMSPNVAFRAVTCKLLADVYILVICGATPPLSQIDELVINCWENYAQTIKEAKLVYPRNFPISLQFETCLLGVFVVNLSNKKCVFTKNIQNSNQKNRMSGSHRIDILRTFYMKAARDIAPELILEQTKEDEENILEGMCETYWCSEYHKCHAQKDEGLLCCALYSSNVPTHTMRFITKKTIQSIVTNKDIYW